MAKATDPVCGMAIETGNAAGKTVYKSHTYYFCSTACLDKFQDDPAGYSTHRSGQLADAPAADELNREAPFTRSGGMAAPKFGSAGSGGLEHERIPEADDKG